MKNIFNLNIIVVISLLCSTGCDPFLEEQNISGLTADEYYATEEGIESLVNACYTHMRYWYGKEDGIALTETGTDIFTRGAGMENPPAALYNSNLSGENPQLTFHWERFYTALNTCNAAIGRIPNSPMDESMKPIRTAEARFLRAFYLWHIVETWGGVHLTTEEVSDIQLTANRTPVEQFYAQIFEDLNFSIENLPESSPDHGRAIKPAAEAFAARMHLTRGNNAEAARLARNVIENYSYSLVPSYEDLWDINNIRNNEIVWFVNFTSDQVLNLELEHPDLNMYPTGNILLRDGGNNSHLFFLMTYDQLPGMLRDIEYGRPFARFMPTAHLLDLFDETIDTRFNTTFQTVWDSNNPGTYNLNLSDGSTKEVTYAEGDTAIFATKYALSPADKDARNYEVIDRTRTYNANDAPVVRDRFMSLKKFLDPSRPTISMMQGQRDGWVIRLAEMYMVVAEAEMNQGNMDIATNYFNEVRRRAAYPGSEDAMTVASSELTIDLILDERAREFAGEQHRWFDLKRTGKLIERVQMYNPDAAPNIMPFHTVRPIPQSQLDIVENKSEFTQNEGYF